VVNSCGLNEQNIPDAIQKLNNFKPRLIRGYLSAFIQLAEYMRDHKLELHFKPVAVSSTTETLLDPFRKLVEEQFHSKLYDQYGCGECNSIAFEAGDGKGLYVAAEHVMLEILGESGTIESSKEGRLIITNLDNYVMPFIRYENGDIGQFQEKNISKKFNLPLLKSISGRSADTIALANGSKVHGVFFTDILNELFVSNPMNIHRFQVYQKQAGEIEFRIESNKQLPRDLASILEKTLYRFFNQVSIITMESLPHDKSGKFRYILTEKEK
jgi:phenylacetate-CoA ligase